MSTSETSSQHQEVTKKVAKNRPRSQYILFLVIVVGFTLVVIWAALALFVDFRKDTRQDYFATYDLKRTKSMPTMVLALELTDFVESNAKSAFDELSSGTNPSSVKLSLVGLYLAIDPSKDICIEKIYIEHLTQPEKLFREAWKAENSLLPTDIADLNTTDIQSATFSLAPVPVMEFSDLCSQDGIITQDGSADYYMAEGRVVNMLGISQADFLRITQAIEISAVAGGRTRFFPFDRFNRDLVVQVQGKGSDGKSLTLAPEVVLFLNLDDVSEKITSQKIKFSGESDTATAYGLQGETTALSIQLLRPFGKQLLTILLLFGALCFIVSLMFVSDTGSALEVAVAILLGLWGIQSVLIPDDIQSTNIVNSAILFLYLLLLWAAAARFLFKPFLWRHSRPPAEPPDNTGPFAEQTTTAPPRADMLTSETTTNQDPSGPLDGSLPAVADSQTNTVARFRRIVLILLSASAILIGLLHFRLDRHSEYRK